MKSHHSILWAAGWTGLIGGLTLAALSVFVRAELLSLAGGYGLMTAGSAVYLLVGLKVRETLAARRARPARVPTAG
jgi:hypothetical protein